MTTPEGAPLRVEMSDEARQQLMDAMAEDPDLGAKFEEVIAVIARDPEGVGELAGKVYRICGHDTSEDNPHGCVRRYLHDGDHSFTLWEDRDGPSNAGAEEGSLGATSDGQEGAAPEGGE